MVQETLLKDNLIVFDSAGLRSKFAVRFNLNRGKNQQQSVRYLVGLEFVSNSKIAIHTSHYLLNNLPSSSLVEILAEQCRKPLNHLVLDRDENGLLTGISNYSDVLKIWEEVRNEVKLRFSGEILERYISKQDEVIYNHELLLHKLKEDFFYNQFFVGIYNVAFTNYQLKLSEQSKFLGVSYALAVHYHVDKDVSGNSFITKKIDETRYDAVGMPVDFYEVKYVLEQNSSISLVEGKFKAQGQEVIFSIIKTA